MKIKTIKVTDAIYVDVICAHNDPVDIKCGGPATLGYGFYVSPDTNVNELEKKIIGWLKKYNREFMRIIFTTKQDFNIKYLWDDLAIERCIKENSVV